jgi:hypothetical protein
MSESAEFFAISERQQVAAEMSSAQVPLNMIGEAACRVFDLADACGSQMDLLESFDPPTPDVQARMRALIDRRCVLTILGMKLAGTPEAATQFVDAVVEYTHSQDG